MENKHKSLVSQIHKKKENTTLFISNFINRHSLIYPFALYKFTEYFSKNKIAQMILINEMNINGA